MRARASFGMKPCWAKVPSADDADDGGESELVGWGRGEDVVVPALLWWLRLLRLGRDGRRRAERGRVRVRRIGEQRVRGRRSRHIKV